MAPITEKKLNLSCYFLFYSTKHFCTPKLLNANISHNFFLLKNNLCETTTWKTKTQKVILYSKTGFKVYSKCFWNTKINLSNKYLLISWISECRYIKKDIYPQIPIFKICMGLVRTNKTNQNKWVEKIQDNNKNIEWKV